MRLQDQVTLVTGGNSGIGLGIARLAAAEGAKVVIAARDEQRGGEAVDILRREGGEAIFVATDLRIEEQVQDLLEQIVGIFGRLNIVVNNAGAGARRSGVSAGDTPGRRWEKLGGANFTTTYLVSALALPKLREAGGGAIVNISSTAAIHGNYGIYGAAKAGVEALTRGLAVEGAPHHIRVNCVSPGWIRTEATVAEDQLSQPERERRAAWEKSSSLLQRMGRTDEVAQAVVFLASEQASFITGATLVVDGGLTIIDPTADAWLETVGENRFKTSG